MIRPSKPPLEASDTSETKTRGEIRRQISALGLSDEEVARAMKVAGRSGSDDFLLNAVNKSLSCCPETHGREDRRRVYAKAFEAFAQHYFQISWNPSEKIDPVVIGTYQALKTYLEIDHIFRVAEGIAGAVRCWVFPEDPEEYRGCRKLIDTIFGKGQEKESFTASRLVDGYLNAILHGTPPPSDRTTISDAMAAWAVATYSDSFRAPFAEEHFESIQTVLKFLPVRQEKVVRLRFGISSPSMDRKEIAERFDVSELEIKQIEAKALRKLRSPGFVRKLLQIPLSPAQATRMASLVRPF
ncbi:MAG TPA: sigma factor-like helix-turn-helix DNA-binding protein [Bryobacteraceae bacterium]|nr:sigma factor-like helix-turn-helix DNA-binding protein [Bryobacteraceae bacterium]